MDLLISRVFTKDFNGKSGEILVVPSPERTTPERIVFLGLGEKERITEDKIRQAGGRAASYLRELGMKKIAFSCSLLSSLRLSPALVAEGALLGHYTYKRYTKEKNTKKIESLTLLSKRSRLLGEEVSAAVRLASAACFARDLVNTPSNDMTPSQLARAAVSLRGKRLSVKILGSRDAGKLGMGAYLSVAKGSHEPLKFIILEYKGARTAPVALVGKSITFDSGGLSLKPSEGMEKMKYDMAGGAAVLGAIKFASESNLGINVVAVLPATENLPGGSATRPGDVVKSISGTTVEIVNTDAEGRLTLADGIGYVKRFRPRAIIDIATLTGACSIALGGEAIAMMSNDDVLASAVKKAADAVNERVWRMPLFEEYKEYIKSDVADLKNTGGRTGSLAASAAFLGEFAEGMPWVHLDIAGTAWMEKERPYLPKGATGVGVRLLSRLLKELA